VAFERVNLFRVWLKHMTSSEKWHFNMFF